MLCIKCNSNNVSTNNGVESISYRGNELSLEMEYSLCGECGREFITKPQIQANDKRIRNAQRGADGLLVAEEISGIRDRLGLTQQQAAQVFGGGANAFSKYERSEVIQSASMDKLIRLASSNAMAFSNLLAMADLVEPTPQVEEETAKYARVFKFHDNGKYEDYCSNDKDYAAAEEIFG